MRRIVFSESQQYSLHMSRSRNYLLTPNGFSNPKWVNLVSLSKNNSTFTDLFHHSDHHNKTVIGKDIYYKTEVCEGRPNGEKG